METGRITKWDDAKGFGFITPHCGGKDVFVHITAIRPLIRRPQGGETVSFVREKDENGRLRAAEVSFVGVAVSEPNTLIPTWALAVSLSALGISVAAVIGGWLHFFAPLAYTVMSLLSYATYAVDKSRAQHDDWRVPENTIHFIDLLGGWPGGLLAQQLLRHKVAKATFQSGFWFTVIANVGLFVSLSQLL